MKLLEQASTPCIEIILLGNEQCPCFISSSVKSLVKVQFVKISMKCHPRSAVMLSPCHLFWLLMTFSQRCVWRNWRLCFDQLPPNVRSICFASNSFSCHQKPGPGQHCSWRFASGRTFFLQQPSNHCQEPFFCTTSLSVPYHGGRVLEERILELSVG